MKMSEQVNNNQPGTGEHTAQQDNKTFTQEDINRIVQERLAKERSKGDATLAEREQELAKREFMLKAKEIFAEKKLPLELLDAIKADNEDELNASLAILEKLFDIGSDKPTPTIVLGGTGGGGGQPKDRFREAMGLR